MRPNTQWSVLLSLAALSLGLAIGCSPRKVREEVRQVTGQVDPTWEEQRSDFIRKTNNRLDDVSQTVNRLNTEKFKNNRKQVEARRHVSDMQSLMVEVRRGLRDLQQAGPERWVQKRNQVRTSLNKLESHYEDAQKLLE